MLGVLLYGDNEAEQYIRKVEGEDVAHGCKPEASRTNWEYVRCREQAVDAVREVLWRVDGTMDPVAVPPPEVGAAAAAWRKDGPAAALSFVATAAGLGTSTSSSIYR